MSGLCIELAENLATVRSVLKSSTANVKHRQLLVQLWILRRNGKRCLQRGDGFLRKVVRGEEFRIRQRRANRICNFFWIVDLECRRRVLQLLDHEGLLALFLGQLSG